MQRVDFFRLERSIQERFVASSQGTAPPLPLAVLRQGLPRAVWVWLGIAMLALVALGVLTRVGYGQLNSPLALQPREVVLIYGGLGTLVGLAALFALRKQRSGHSLPFAPGIYLFPSGVIDTRRAEFEVRKLNELVGAVTLGRSLQLRFDDGAEFRFPVDSPARADELLRTLEEVRKHFSDELAPASSRELAVYDPLLDNGFRNPFSPRESLLPPRPRFAISAWLVVVLVGAGLGVGLWFVRNSLAEAALYRAARAENSQAGYRAYLARGGKNPDVASILLPRAELAELVKRRSIEELEGFSKRHSNSPIQAEIQAALHQELVVALEAAKREGTLQALKRFRSRFLEYPRIIAEIDRAISERLTAGLREFERRARPKPEVLELFRQLLNYSANNEGRVVVRFRRRLSESAAKAEALLQKSNYFGGKASLPAQYFDARRAAEREQPIGREIVNTLSLGFSPDLLKFEVGSPLPDSGEEDPKVDVPSIIVTHRTEMSGAYLMKRPRAALTGIGVLFRVVFAVPGAPTSHAFKYSAWNAPELKSMMDGQSFAQIYGEMGEKAFSKLGKRYLNDLVPGLVAAAKAAAAPTTP